MSLSHNHCYSRACVSCLFFRIICFLMTALVVLSILSYYYKNYPRVLVVISVRLLYFSIIVWSLYKMYNLYKYEEKLEEKKK